jgi:hypothetical protein
MPLLKRGMSWNSIIEASSNKGSQLSWATLAKRAKRLRATV